MPQDRRDQLAADDTRNLEAFHPIKLQKAADAVIAIIADAIRGGLYEVGDLLPSERSLAGQLQVSRAVVREAIDVLRREGILSVKRGRAGGIMFVSDAQLHQVVRSLRGKTHDLMRATLEVRRSLEIPAFLLTAQRATDAEMAGLEDLVTALEGLADVPEEFFTRDLAFHRTVVRLAGNPLLANCYTATIDQLLEIRQEFPVLQVGFERGLRNQRTLYAALRTRDPADIRTAVDAHLAATEIIYLGERISGLETGPPSP